ncbi:purine-binding chemotaxis protein CheW [Hymenobacter daecheongensis DSM 21074]|uniref:Purine-binding chemotaxis protein CheW n=1 Tax=Hymenobacter daecheongensis DSM 21074 TaxID=1121955 RepID=A0A1M6ECP1_9BACT|nr:chemotaxis protein CheW [Hymenobacter daecheongensis]SHI83235.1 purine-binding chemotaxis protein CheW [Hymenobacter daecheongensis DSM 21074]
MAETESTGEKKVVKQDKLIQLIVFRLGDEEYGIRIEQVKEVTVTPEIARMPKTPAFVKGIANLRGDIIAIIDLEERFKLRSASQPLVGLTYTLAVEAKDYTIGIVVREVPQPLSIPMSIIEKAPEFIQDINIHDKYIEGIAKVDERIIIVLDMLKLLTPEEIMQLQPKSESSSARART